MFSLFTPRKPSDDRLDMALNRPKEVTSFAPRRIRQRAFDDRLYFYARSVAANGVQHLLQYAFADDAGNVVMSLIAQAPRPVPAWLHEPAAMVVDPVAPEALDAMLGSVVAGANIVTFGRVLQTGMLPRGLIESAASVECAWRRHLKLRRQRRGTFDRHQPVTLSDALAEAGLPQPGSEDAAVRALALRDLWLWMDGIELGRRRSFGFRAAYQAQG